MTFAENKKARHDYLALETFEGGLVLSGAEVKSVREGGAKLQGAYLFVRGGEVWLTGCHIARYSKASRQTALKIPLSPHSTNKSAQNHQESTDDTDLTRDRKVLLHTREIADLAGKIQQKGLTLVPFSLYPRGRRVKLSFGLCRGEKAHDKRETLKARDLDRSTRRVMRGEDE